MGFFFEIVNCGEKFLCFFCLVMEFIDVGCNIFRKIEFELFLFWYCMIEMCCIKKYVVMKRSSNVFEKDKKFKYKYCYM